MVTFAEQASDRGLIKVEFKYWKVRQDEKRWRGMEVEVLNGYASVLGLNPPAGHQRNFFLRD